jgi:transcriptional regulator with XRE-family HTH domain
MSEPGPVEVGRWIRAARRARGVSQRELAALAHVELSIIARAEVGRTTPRLPTVLTLLDALGYRPFLADWRGRILELDLAHDRLADAAGRQFPAHLRWGRTPTIDDGGWWGWYRIAWDRWEAPAYTYWRRRPPPELRPPPPFLSDVWQDAT